MAKSLQEFRQWAIAKNKTGNPGTNSYVGQCVSLVQQYLHQVYGIPYQARGNAWEFVPPTFKRVTSTPKKGDIVRYGQNYGGGYGHIGIIDDDGKFLDQNGTKRLAVARRNTPFSGYESVWRPTKSFRVYKPAPKPKKKSNDTIANEVIAGKWGNNPQRISRLKKAGYNPSVIQALVNKKMTRSKPAPKSKAPIRRGDIVMVLKPVDEKGRRLYVSGKYKVMEVVGNRVVIGKNGVVTAAVHKSNLKKS